MHELFTACGEDCKERKMITDSFGFYHLTAEGVAKTNRIVVEVLPNVPGSKSFLKENTENLKDESFAFVSNVYLISTKVMEEFKPVSNEFPAIENGIQSAFDDGIVSAATNKLFGILRYGQELNAHSGSAAHIMSFFSDRTDIVAIKGLFNNEAHDVTISCWWQFLRTGKRSAWEYALKKSRNLIDLSTVWMNQNDWAIGLQGRHSMYPWSNSHITHSLAGGLSLFHFLTGSRRARQAIVNLGEASLKEYWDEYKVFGRYKSRETNNPQPTTTALRAHTAPWLNLMYVYELTRDPKYLIPIHKFLDTLTQIQREDGALPGTSVGIGEDGKLSEGSKFGSSQPSLWIALQKYIQLFGVSQSFKAFLLKFLQWELTADLDQSVVSKHQRKLALMAWAYRETNDPIYLIYYPTLSAQASSMSAHLARTHLPRTIGPYLLEVKRYIDGGGGEEALYTRFSQWLFTRDKQQCFGFSSEDNTPKEKDFSCIEVSVEQNSPLVLTLNEESDRSFLIHMKARYNNKHSETAVRVEVHSPVPNAQNETLLFFKEYCDKKNGCPNNNEIQRVDAERVELQVHRQNNPAYRADGERWGGENLTLKVKRDGVVGNYVIKVLPLAGAEGFSKNAIWRFTTSLSSTTELHTLSGIKANLKDPLLLKSSFGRFIYGNNPQAVRSLKLETENYFSALLRLDLNLLPHGEVAGQDFVSIWKQSYEFVGDGELLPTPGIVQSYIPFGLTHGLNFGESKHQLVRLSESNGNNAQIALNGRYFLEKVNILNADFEQTQPQADNIFSGWTSPEHENFTVTLENKVIEGTTSVLLQTPSSTLSQTLVGQIQAGDTLVLRIMGQSSHSTGCFIGYKPIIETINAGDVLDPVGESIRKKHKMPGPNDPILKEVAITVQTKSNVTQHPIRVTGFQLTIGSYTNIVPAISDGDELDCRFDFIELYIMKRAE